MHKVFVTADQSRLDQLLQYCREKYGHSKIKGQKSVWTWRVRTTYRARNFIFSFENEQDALAFKLTKG